MIRIGLSSQEKQKELSKYLESHGIDKIFCFYHKNCPITFKVGCSIEYIEYSNIVMYKYFYRLLEEIGETSLIVLDGCMRTQNRNDLTYNCVHHYCNQTSHKIIFEFFPIIDNKDDFMILLDFEDKTKYKSKLFDYVFLQTENIKIKPFRMHLQVINVMTSRHDLKRYKKKRDQLFADLGEKDPNTIPRALQLLAGDIKKNALNDIDVYVARNKRIKLDNVRTYEEISGKGDFTIIDMHYRRLNFNDFLKAAQLSKLRYLSTTLPIDTVLASEFMKWKARVDAIYVQANLYK